METKVSDLLDLMGYGDNNAFNRVLYSMAAILIALIMVGSISLIYNAFAISVSERSKLFGMLSSVGASSRQIRNSVFFEAGVISLIGLPLGILSGVAGIGVTLALLDGVITSTFLSGPNAVDFRMAVYPAALAAGRGGGLRHHSDLRLGPGPPRLPDVRHRRHASNQGCADQGTRRAHPQAYAPAVRHGERSGAEKFSPQSAPLPGHRFLPLYQRGALHLLQRLHAEHEGWYHHHVRRL